MSGLDFTGRRVLVTGASHGIGFAVARAFATAGAELAIISSTDDIHDAAARIRAESGRPVEALPATSASGRPYGERSTGSAGWTSW